jgi:hypothetical protein
MTRTTNDRSAQHAGKEEKKSTAIKSSRLKNISHAYKFSIL